MNTSSIQDILMMYVWEDDLELTRREEIVAHAQPKLFDFPYPLYDSKMKDQFEEDFIRHFYTREIGSESIALFKLRLQDYLYLNSEKWERLYKSMDETLNPFNNIDVKTTRDTTEDEQTDTDATETDLRENTRSQQTEEDRDRTRTLTKEEQEDGTSGQQTEVSTQADDFTRSLEQTPPDERLSITAQDGVGVIDYASNIQENKNVNTSTQNSDTQGTSGRTVTGSDSEKDIDGKSRTTQESEQQDRNRSELEQQLRAFEQALNEHRIGRDTRQSFVELYNEYIQHFQGLHRLMFKDMEKLFLGVF